MTWIVVTDRKANPVIGIILVIVRLPYLVPFMGWIWFGIVAFNWQKLPWFVLVPVLFWSFVCSQAAPESAEKIKADIRENGGVVETRHEIWMILFILIQYPTFLAAAWILWDAVDFLLQFRLN